MKRLFLLLLAFCLVISLSGCQNHPEQDGSNPNPQGDDSGSSKPQTEDKGTLVVYFSATGNTARIASAIAEITGGKLMEIKPAQPYSDEDLNYSDHETRATREQNDPSARPQLAARVSISGYSTVYLGYPIWWGQAPRILATFVESQDFNGVTVIPFCTSGSSDIGNSAEELARLANGGNWQQGKRFGGKASFREVQQWIAEKEEKPVETTLHLYINEQEVPVSWQNNRSVSALKQLAGTEGLKVSMSMYGGFEQVGDLGAKLESNDRETTTGCGDIVLYSSRNIVIFYGSNSWSYTRLGHVDLSEEEIRNLLGQKDVTVTLKVTEKQ